MLSQFASQHLLSPWSSSFCVPLLIISKAHKNIHCYHQESILQSNMDWPIIFLGIPDLPSDRYDIAHTTFNHLADPILSRDADQSLHNKQATVDAVIVKTENKAGGATTEMATVQEKDAPTNEAKVQATLAYESVRDVLGCR